jgi:outer membrane lipoprotein-sorting protein
MSAHHRNRLIAPAERALKFCLYAVFFLSVNLAAPGFEIQGQKDSQLQRAFKMMDEVANGFRSFAAKFSQKTYTAILEEFDTPQTGEYYYSFDKDGSALWRHETKNPSARILTVRNCVATLYQPKIKKATIFNLGKRREYVEYMAAGIGKSSAELQEKFHVSDQGSESIGGEPCFLLLCKPKDPKVADQISSITIWLKKASGMPAQFKIQAPSDDFLLVTFSEEKLNLEIPDSRFEQKLPKGIDIIRIQ